MQGLIYYTSNAQKQYRTDVIYVRDDACPISLTSKSAMQHITENIIKYGSSDFNNSSSCFNFTKDLIETNCFKLKNYNNNSQRVDLTLSDLVDDKFNKLIWNTSFIYIINDLKKEFNIYSLESLSNEKLEHRYKSLNLDSMLFSKSFYDEDLKAKNYLKIGNQLEHISNSYINMNDLTEQMKLMFEKQNKKLNGYNIEKAFEYIELLKQKGYKVNEVKMRVEDKCESYLLQNYAETKQMSLIM